jgi:hypothetical protein
VRDIFDSLVSQVNEQIVQVTDKIKEIAKELIHEVDQKLNEVTCNIVINKKGHEIFSNLEDNIKAVQSGSKGDVTKWQSETKEQVNKEIKQFESCEARLDKMNAEIDNMKVKIAERSAMVGNTGSLPPTDGNLDACQSACGSANTLEGEVNQTAPCTIIDSANINNPMCNNHVPSGGKSETSVCMPTTLVCNASSFIAPSDLTLPRFNDSYKVNALFFLRQLDDFMRLKAVPVRFQLATALKSITDPLAVDWLSAVAPHIQNYEQFKLTFRRNFWSASKQSIVKCSIYQDRYQKCSNLSMSEHFLKCAVLASYLSS